MPKPEISLPLCDVCPANYLAKEVEAAQNSEQELVQRACALASDMLRLAGCRGSDALNYYPSQPTCTNWASSAASDIIRSARKLTGDIKLDSPPQQEPYKERTTRISDKDSTRVKLGKPLFREPSR